MEPCAHPGSRTIEALRSDPNTRCTPAAKFAPLDKSDLLQDGREATRNALSANRKEWHRCTGESRDLCGVTDAAFYFVILYRPRRLSSSCIRPVGAITGTPRQVEQTPRSPEYWWNDYPSFYQAVDFSIRVFWTTVLVVAPLLWN